MKKFRVMSLVLTLVMLCSILSACCIPNLLPKKVEDTVDVEVNEYAEQTEEVVEETTAEVEKGEPQKSDRKLEAPTAKKVGSFKDGDYLSDTDGGWYYKSGEKYGIISLDGSKVTPAKYEYVQGEGDLFAVATKLPTSNSVTAQNCCGLVDDKGNVVVEEKYAAFNKINERYYKTMEVTEETDNEDEALVYATDRMISISAEEGDTLYKGVWKVYDIVEKRFVKGAEGTVAYAISAYGNYLKFTTDDKKDHTVDPNGNELPENATLFENGCYKAGDYNEGSVYDENGKKLFDYSADGFAPSFSTGDYFSAAQYGSSTKYALLDREGKVVSAEYDDIPYVYGNVVQCDEKIMDFEGNEIYSGASLRVSFDDATQAAIIAEDNEKVMYLDLDGNVLASIDKTEDMFVSTSDFFVSDKIDDVSKYYCLEKKAFEFEGMTLENWLLSNGETYDDKALIETIKGSKLIEHCTDYKVSNVVDNKAYVFAQKADRSFDIYCIEY